MFAKLFLMQAAAISAITANAVLIQPARELLNLAREPILLQGNVASDIPKMK